MNQFVFIIIEPFAEYQMTFPHHNIFHVLFDYFSMLKSFNQIDICNICDKTPALELMYVKVIANARYLIANPLSGNMLIKITRLFDRFATLF